jgi:hypothetical protein
MSLTEDWLRRAGFDEGARRTLARTWLQSAIQRGDTSAPANFRKVASDHEIEAAERYLFCLAALCQSAEEPSHAKFSASELTFARDAGDAARRRLTELGLLG